MNLLVRTLSHLLSLQLIVVSYAIEGECLNSDDPTCGASSPLPPDFVDSCVDLEPSCSTWSKEGQCRANPTYMLDNCPMSCGICKPLKVIEKVDDEDGNDVCMDLDSSCSEWTEAGECLMNPEFMLEQCKYSCWVCFDPEKDRNLGLDEETLVKKDLYFNSMSLGRHQLLREIDANDREKVETTIRLMDHYARHVITSPNVHMKARERCRNEFRMCAEWAARGYCFPAGHPEYHIFFEKDGNDVREGFSEGGGRSKDVLFMMNMCPLACRTCEEVPSLACAGKRHPRSRPSLEKNGGVDAFFENLMREETNAMFVSSPNESREGNENDSYVAVVPNFLAEDQVAAILSLGKAIGWSPSNTAKCRSNDHCTAYQLEADATYKQIMERVVSLANSNLDYLEPMEIHRFKTTSSSSNEFSGGGLLHNYELSGVWKPSGPRVLSLFIFLSDNQSPSAGQLGFPRLDWLLLKPKRGMAIFWPNVINEDVWEIDPLTAYEYMWSRDTGNRDEGLFGAIVHLRLHNWTDANYRNCA